MPRQWTEEQKQRQRELILSVRPWERSTGPTSTAGKARSVQNALRHGKYSATSLKLRKYLKVIRQIDRIVIKFAQRYC